MQLKISTERGAPVKPAALKHIATTLSDYLKVKGRFDVHVTWAALAKMRLLNRTWRKKDKPTNVLSYPQFEPDDLKKELGKLSKHASLHLGDVVLCLPYIEKEAKALKKPLNHHLTHLVVHGILHLLGYDHVQNRKAVTMEKLEKRILAALDIPDPYALPKATPSKRATPKPKRP